MEASLFVPQLEAVRAQTTEQLAALLESQIRTRQFAESVTQMVHQVHQEVVGAVRQYLASIHELARNLEDAAPLSRLLSDLVQRCTALDQAIALLTSERQRQFYKNGAFLQAVLLNTHSVLDEFTTTLISKELLERQSQVLQSIILSYERIAQWKVFVQEILGSFHAIFPFNFFFIAFAEEHEISLYLYHLGDYSEEIKQAARKRLTQKMLQELNLPLDAAVAIEEYQVRSTNGLSTIEDLHMLTVMVPEHAPKLAGLLGVAFVSAYRRSPQEEAIIRSILAVMVMVVGSSKVLSRTLAELEYYSMHDPLTGLYNRRHFTEMLTYEIERSERHSHEFSILLIDLDDFKDINDSYGHPTGDKVLCCIAETLRTGIRKGDVTTRLGGDEFAVLLPETPSQGALKLGETIRQKVHKLRFTDPAGKTFRITVSIGIASYPQDGESASDLLAAVDVALYRAKGAGKNSVFTLTAAEQELYKLRHSRAYAEKLREALNEKRIIPHFQPIFEVATGKLFAYETVARLIEPSGEIIAASQFIEVIEKYGLSVQLDRNIISSALQSLSVLKDESLRLFINLSATNLQSRRILGYAEQLCQKYAIAPARIIFEITERDAISDMTHMRRFLASLRKKGFAFALDDFGSGYNSFHYLRELKFEYVKIDGAFVRHLLTSHIDYSLVRNLINLCRDLGILTVAECVENAEILAALKNMRVDYAQGFHLGLPSPLG